MYVRILEPSVNSVPLYFLDFKLISRDLCVRFYFGQIYEFLSLHSRGFFYLSDLKRELLSLKRER